MQRVEATIAKLEAMTHSELRHAWGELLREACPAIGSKRLMKIMLAGRLQEQAHGGLAISVRGRLRRLAEKYAENPSYVPSDVPRFKPGSALTRIWKGVRYEVRVGTNGTYRFKGDEYESLSEIARVITGTRWSGPRFFGLTSKS